MEKSMDSLATKKVSVHIPNDIALSILSKLPLKSLKRFSSVRKSWSRLFENPNFMNMYRNNFISSEEDGSCLLLQQTLPYPSSHRHVLYLLSGESFENRVKLGSPPPFGNDSGFILGPVINGIVCLYQYGTNVALWNPTTEEFKVLPPSPCELEPSVRYEIQLDRLHGFGYDRVRDDYKVIRYVHYVLNLSDNESYSDFEDESDNSDFEGDALNASDSDCEGDALSLPTCVTRDDVWEIYSLRSNSWRKLDLDMPCGMKTDVGVYVYLNGACHWWDADDDDDEAYLVSFDLSKEVFCITPMPSTLFDNFDSEYEMRHLTVLNDHIALITYDEKTPTFHISILGEVGVKKSWTKLFILGPLPDIHHPIGEGKNGDLFFRRKDNKLVSFNLRTQMMKELGIKGEMHCCQVVIYKESHLPIGEING